MTINATSDQDALKEKSMFAKIVITLVLLSLVASVHSAAAEAVWVHNSAEPLAAPQTVSLRESWRVGTDGEVFFGEVASVISSSEGQVYVLDSQQCQVYVFDSAGQLLQALSREGDGPGEIRHPAGIFFTDDAGLAIVRTYPAEFVFLDQAGIPAGRIKVPALGSKSQGLYFLDDVTPIGAAASGDIVVAGGADSFGSDRPERTRFIARFTGDAKEVARYHEDRQIRDHDTTLNELLNYFPNGDRHCLGPDGRVYLAPERNSYRIEVFEPGGEHIMTIEREFESRRRDKLERELVEAGYGGHANRHGADAQFKVEATAPDIDAMHVTAGGLLLVQHSRSHIGRPEGVLLTYDVFGPDGRLLRQLSIECDGDVRRDRLVPLPDGRWVRVAGAIDSIYAVMGGGLNLPEGEDYPLELICYVEK